ncbi:MAG TPA: prolyl oligopeptidase family serine peptidase, partial [Polyangia bacterium]|nr:prolyl oligopeptidase family serine peptidase [Polyangia bacterium]
MSRWLWGIALLSLGCATARPTPPAQPPLPPAPLSAPATVAKLAPPPQAAVEDPYLWLEEVTAERSLAWVRERNQTSMKELGTPAQEALKKRLLAIYDSKEKIPYVAKLGKRFYNFWRDEHHIRGVWRRATLAEYRKDAPEWETVLDIDALARAENENWVWKGDHCLRPKYERCLLFLSRAGADAVVIREFDARTKKFVDGGFILPEAKSRVSWKDEDTLFVGTDFGPGSLTNSGYPRIIKEWRRGTPLAEAKTLFEGETTDVSVGAHRDWHQGRWLDVISRHITRYESETFLLEDGARVLLDRPGDANVSFFADYVLLQLRSDWTTDGKTWPAGALLAARLNDYRAGSRAFELVYEPGKNHSLSEYSGTKNALILNVLEDVHTHVRVAKVDKGHFVWRPLPVTGLGTYGASAVDDDEGDRYWFHATDFLHPDHVELGDLATGKRERLKSAPAFFKADGLETRQLFAISPDGTRVPYFQVARKGLPLDGSHPTLLTGYGGFEVPMLPGYSATIGAAWLEAGGVYVLANIRGGGEYGPAWHQAGLKQHRQRVYDDFIAVASDLIARKVTRPQKLGIMGGSNGGLLTGVMLTQRP